MTLANVIKEKTGKNMREFSEITDWSYDTLKSWSVPRKTKKHRNPREENINKLADLLGIGRETVIKLTTLPEATQSL